MVDGPRSDTRVQVRTLWPHLGTPPKRSRDPQGVPPLQESLLEYSAKETTGRQGPGREGDVTYRAAALEDEIGGYYPRSLAERAFDRDCRHASVFSRPYLDIVRPAADVARFGGDPRSEARKPEDKTERLGQVPTPPGIAIRLVASLLGRLHGPKILDPCVGLHTFPEALIRYQEGSSRTELTCVDVDPEMVECTEGWSTQNGVPASVVLGDYLAMPMNQTFDGAILNPPYVRQEWIDKKRDYRELFASRYDVAVPGTSNLYVYFIVKVLQDLRPGGAFACIVYDSWQSTRFGQWLAGYLQHECTELSVEPVHGTPFDGRLIDATILTGLRRRSSAPSPIPEPAIGNPRSSPFSGIPGFEPLASLVPTRRGLRLKQADFFLTTSRDIPRKGATPFLKKVAKVPGFCVPRSHDEAAFLITEPAQNSAAFEELLHRLSQAMADPADNVSILTWYRERPETWFRHRPAPYAPVVFNYYIRNRPRHISNLRHRYADNFYGMTPKGEESPFTYLGLMNSTAVCTEILAHARNQGDGLAKIQLFEYRQVLIPSLRALDGPSKESLQALGEQLAHHPEHADDTVREIDSVIYQAFGHPCLAPEAVHRKYLECDAAAKRPRA